METIFKKQVIKKIIIDKDYSITGNDIHKNIALSGIDMSVLSLIKIMEISKFNNIPMTIKDTYYKFFKELNIDYDMNYYNLLGDIKSREYLNTIKDFINFTKDKITTYHLKYFPIRKNSAISLHQVCLDDKVLDVPIYNHNSTTGRSSIENGYNFLIMKKSERKNLKPINDNDMLVEVDFKSCEPFFYINALNKFNNHKIDDVYEFISKAIGYDYDSRDVFKRGLLSVIYGANEATVSKIMRTDLKIVKKIKKLLEIIKCEIIKAVALERFIAIPHKIIAKVRILNYF